MSLTQSEKQIENSILDFLKAHKIFCWKNETVGIFDRKRGVYRKKHGHNLKGVSDILGIYDGKFLAIEVKKPKSYPTKEQRVFLEMVKKNGGIGFIARSIDDVIQNLKINKKD